MAETVDGDGGGGGWECEGLEGGEHGEIMDLIEVGCLVWLSSVTGVSAPA